MRVMHVQEPVDPMEHPYVFPGFVLARIRRPSWWGKVVIGMCSAAAFAALLLGLGVEVNEKHFVALIVINPVLALLTDYLRWTSRRAALVKQNGEGEIGRRRLGRMALAYAEWPVFLVGQGVRPDWESDRNHPFVTELADMSVKERERLLAAIPVERMETYRMMLERSRRDAGTALKQYAEEYTVPLDGRWVRAHPLVRMAVLPPRLRNGLPW